jgi:hypothetical protein
MSIAQSCHDVLPGMRSLGFTVEDVPVTVAVDSADSSVHQTGLREWQARIGKIPVFIQ